MGSIDDDLQDQDDEDSDDDDKDDMVTSPTSMNLSSTAPKGSQQKKFETEEEKRRNFLERNRQGKAPSYLSPR